MNERSDAASRRGRRAKFWWAIGIVLGLFVAWRLVTLAVFWHAKSNLTKMGLPTTLTELDTWYSSQAGGTKTAAAQEDMLSQLSHPEQWPNLSEILDQTDSGSTGIVRENASGLARLTESSGSMPHRYSVDLTLGFDAKLPHLSHIQNACRLARVEALNRWVRGDRRGSIEALGLIASLTRSLEHEPLLISHLLQCSCSIIYTDAVDAILQHAMPSAHDRDAILKQIDQVESSLQPSRAYAGEYVLALHSMRQAHTDHDKTFPIAHPCSFGAVHHLYAISGLLDLDLASHLRLYEETVVAASQEYSQARVHIRRIQLRATAQPAIHVLARRSHTTTMFAGLSKSASVKAKLRCTRAAVLALAFAETNGRPPASLTELDRCTPGSLLTDPFIDAPLVLRNVNGAVTARSVGHDLSDPADDIVVDVPLTGVGTDNKAMDGDRR